MCIFIASILAEQWSFSVPNTETTYTKTKNSTKNVAPQNKGNRTFEWASEHPDTFFAGVVAVFTAVLAISTTLLWWETVKTGRRQREDMVGLITATNANAAAAASQVEAMRQLHAATEAQERVLRESVEAAMLTARNLLRASRPLCILDELKLDTFSGVAPVFEFKKGFFLMSVYGTFRNKGNSSAFARDMEMVSSVGPVIGEPLSPESTVQNRVFAYRELKSGEPYTEHTPLHQMPVTKEGLDGRERMFIWGWLRYSDMHGIVRRSGFAFEWIAGIPDIVTPGYFQPCGPTSYWYDVEEDAN